MTRETRIGIVMVLLMVGVFGFLVYKRAVRTSDTADLAKTEDMAEDESEDVTMTRESGAFADDVGTEPEILPVADQTRPMPEAETGEMEDPFGSVVESRPAATPSSAPRMPTMIPEDEEPALESESGLVSGTAQSNEEPGIDATDPFAGTNEVVRQSPSPAARTSPSAALEFGATETGGVEAEQDTFVTETPEPRGPVKQPVTQPVASLDEEPVVSIQSRATLPAETFDFTTPEPEPEFRTVSPRASVPEPTAPELMLDDSDEDRFGGYQPEDLSEAFLDVSVRSAEKSHTAAPPLDSFAAPATSPRAAGVIAGSKYVVQNGDNFWSISQKKYGTGRYFQALAAHNRQQIPDPARMKPGTEMTLPAAEELERRYPSLIPRQGTTDSAPEAVAIATGEYLVGTDGQPRYRVGTGDTLSGIAQKYLGRSRRWEQILEMNRDVLKDGNTLKLGMVLRLPPDAARIQVSNQPGFLR